MKKNEKLQKLTNKICEGGFCSSDVGILLVWLRPAVSKVPILCDLSNFVAHSEGRNQGASYEYIGSYLKNFLDVSEKGGTIYGQKPLFKRDEVIALLKTALKSSGISLDEKKFVAQQADIIGCILDLLDETEFKIKDHRIIRCYLQLTDQGVKFCFQANVQGPAIKMSPGAVWQCNLFD